MDTPRQETGYSLRKKIKRTKFADEVSDPSDLESEDDEEEDDSDISDFEPDRHGIKETAADHELESDEEDFDDEEFEEDREENVDMDANLDPEAEETELMSMFAVRVSKGDVEVVDNDDDALGHVVAVMDGDEENLAFNGTKLFEAETAKNPRSLLKSSVAPQISLFCSVCEEKFHSMSELRHHAAKEHKGSRFFSLPANHPHNKCLSCKVLFESYEKKVMEDANVDPVDLCFPCPHCRRRFIGQLGGLVNHLMRDHRHVGDFEPLPNDEAYYMVKMADSEDVLQCEFCSEELPHVQAFNKHLIVCSDNNSGNSAGLFCHICGKMFAQAKHLKDHLLRYGNDKLALDRNFFCKECPVSCISQDELDDHYEKEHSNVDPDLDFVLHQDCQKCDMLYGSYLENKKSGKIAHRDLAFKCPHCCMILYAHPKHAPRYLSNHLKKHHGDLTEDEKKIKKQETSFQVLTKQDKSTLTCEFCGQSFGLRCNYNAHLATCQENPIQSRPGYMCDTCGFVAGTSSHLREHLQTHSAQEKFACDLCDYRGKSSRYLKQHIKKSHTKGSFGKTVACPKCDKMKSERFLSRHMTVCNGRKKSKEKVECDNCEMVFKRKEDMQAHALIHFGQVTCPIHNIFFQNESEVLLHVNQAGPKEKVLKLQCCMCSAQFRHMCVFMKHLRRHLRIMPYRCGLCQKHFNSYSSLSVHQQNIHGAGKSEEVGQKIFECLQCNRTFNTKGHLKEHVEGVHERDKQWNCPVCQKVFSTEKRMKKHLYTSHKDKSDSFRRYLRVEAFVESAITVPLPD